MGGGGKDKEREKYVSDSLHKSNHDMPALLTIIIIKIITKNRYIFLPNETNLRVTVETYHICSQYPQIWTELPDLRP